MAGRLGHAHLLIFPVQAKRLHLGSIEDGIFLSGSDGEKLPRLTKTSGLLLLVPHTAAARAVQIFAVSIFEYGASIRKFAPFAKISRISA